MNSSPRILAITNLYPTPAAPTCGTFVEQQVKGLRGIGLSVEVLLVDRLSGGMKTYWWLKARCRQAIEQSKPDVIHVMYGGVMADIATRVERDCPMVVSFCGTDLLGEPLVPLHRRAISRYSVWASHRAARRADWIIVKSANLEQALPHGIDRSRVSIVPNGVDTNRFQPFDQMEARRRLGWPSDKKTILFASVERHPRKRPELARQAVSRLSDFGVNAEIRLMHGVPHQEVPWWLNASDALLLTSVHEGSANIVKEALACNVPIVSVDVGDVRERLCHVRGCAVVTDAEPTELARALHEVLRDGHRSDGRAHLGDLTVQAVAMRLLSIYSSLIRSYHVDTGALELSAIDRPLWNSHLSRHEGS